MCEVMLNMYSNHHTELGYHAWIMSVRIQVHKLPGPTRLKALQSYISSFQYNFDHGYHFNISKRRPFNEIMNTARCITHAGTHHDLPHHVQLDEMCATSHRNDIEKEATYCRITHQVH